MKHLFIIPSLILGFSVTGLTGCGSEQTEVSSAPSETVPVATTSPATASITTTPTALAAVAPVLTPVATPASTEYVPTPQEVDYMAHFNKTQQLIDKAQSRPNYLQDSAELAASKAEIDTAYNGNIVYAPIPPRFALFHQYFSEALSKQRQVLTLQSFHLAQGTQYLKGPEELKASAELYRLAGVEMKRISEETKGKQSP